MHNETDDWAIRVLVYCSSLF